MNLVERIREVIVENDLNSAAFADKIGVQRSSISHILSGRNKPSLDFVLKILNAFPTVQSDWLLLGKEQKNTKNVSDPLLFTETKESVSTEPKTLPPSVEQTEKVIKPTTDTTQEVERIVIFYNDGTCNTYTNKK